MSDTSECSGCSAETKNEDLNQFEVEEDFEPSNVNDPEDLGGTEEFFYELCDKCMKKFEAGKLEAGYLDNVEITYK